MRTSHERTVLSGLLQALDRQPDTEVFNGQSRCNRFGVEGWALALGQQFQFGRSAYRDANVDDHC